MRREYRVLIVEDAALTAQTYEDYLARLPGFRAVHTAGTLASARQFVAAGLHRDGRFGFDVVLLDLNLPDGHGLDLLQQLRAAGFQGGVLALTAATELPVVRRAFSLGVVQYLVKPFGFDEFAERMTGFRAAARMIAGTGRLSGQEQVDEVFRTSGRRGREELPKGLTEGTLTEVVELLRTVDGGRSAAEVGQACGVSRVTARRYLEHLERTGKVSRSARHGGRGRPEQEYRWAG
jgi:response regulator of citrate/malate metabolism